MYFLFVYFFFIMPAKIVRSSSEPKVHQLLSILIFFKVAIKVKKRQVWPLSKNEDLLSFCEPIEKTHGWFGMYNLNYASIYSKKRLNSFHSDGLWIMKANCKCQPERYCFHFFFFFSLTKTIKSC